MVQDFPGGRLPFAQKIQLEWNPCNGTGFSWLTLNRSADSASPRWTLLALLLTILLCYDFYTHKSLFSAALRYKKEQADSQNWLFTYLYGHNSGAWRCFAKLLHTPCIAMMQRQPFWKIYSESREKVLRRTGLSGSSQMVQWFSGHSGWNGKRGIRLKISIFFGNFPAE